MRTIPSLWVIHFGGLLFDIIPRNRWMWRIVARKRFSKNLQSRDFVFPRDKFGIDVEKRKGKATKRQQWTISPEDKSIINEFTKFVQNQELPEEKTDSLPR